MVSPSQSTTPMIDIGSKVNSLEFDRWRRGREGEERTKRKVKENRESTGDGDRLFRLE